MAAFTLMELLFSRQRTAHWIPKRVGLLRNWWALIVAFSITWNFFALFPWLPKEGSSHKFLQFVAYLSPCTGRLNLDYIKYRIALKRLSKSSASDENKLKKGNKKAIQSVSHLLAKHCWVKKAGPHLLIEIQFPQSCLLHKLNRYVKFRSRNSLVV